MENLWKSVIPADEVVKFLPYKKYYVHDFMIKEYVKLCSYDITP